MQLQRQQGQAPLDRATGAAAFLDPVVDMQARHAPPVLDYADRRHHAIAVTQDAATGRQIDKAQRRGQQRQQDQRQPEAAATAPKARYQRQVAGSDQQQGAARAQQRNQADADQPRRQGGRCSVDRQGAAERHLIGTRQMAELGKDNPHDPGRRPHGEGCRQRLAGQRRSRAGTEPARGQEHDPVGRPQAEATGQRSQHQPAQQARQTSLASVQSALGPLVPGGPGGGAEQVDRQQQRIAVDRVLGHLAQHPDREHLVANAEQARSGQQQQQMPAADFRCGNPAGRGRCRSSNRSNDHALAPVQRQRRQATEQVERRTGQRRGLQAQLRNGDEDDAQRAEHGTQGIG